MFTESWMSDVAATCGISQKQVGGHVHEQLSSALVIRS